MITELTNAYIEADTSVSILETTIGQELEAAAAEFPDQLGLVSGDPSTTLRRRWRFSEMRDQAEAVARILLKDFSSGERIAVWAPNIPEWVLLQLGVAMAGLVLVPLNPAFRKKEAKYALDQSGAMGIFYVPEYRENPLARWVAEFSTELPALRKTVSFDDWSDFCSEDAEKGPLPVVSPTDVAQIQYTSGTTGAPKGALLTHRGVVNNGRLVGMGLGLKPGEAFMNPLPLFHVAGCVVGVMGALTNRAALVQPTALEPALVLDMCESEAVTTMGGVPTVLIAMMEHGGFSERDLSALRTVGGGGASVPASLISHIEETLDVDFSVLFGQTEASCSITKTRPDDSAENKSETVGLPLPQTEVCIVNTETGEIVAPGETGELCTRGYAVMKGYHNMPEATAAAIDGDGWLHTGDLATMDSEGYCRIVGRIKDMIIRGGENIYPREIEEVLFAHPDVGDVAVVGIPDEKWGEQIVAFIRPAPNRQVVESELFEYVRDHLAPFKTPRSWVIVDALPITASGKIQKFVLRQQYLDEML